MHVYVNVVHVYININSMVIMLFLVMFHWLCLIEIDVFKQCLSGLLHLVAL